VSIANRLAELGIVLPKPAAPVASYVPVVIAGGLAHVSGQLPFIDGELVTGRLGDDVGLERGAQAARACALQAGHAHARIDAWEEGLPWRRETWHGGRR
jgi:enamine deaminase RidA (YjgF/YER057c/UK114 family)